MSKYIWEVEFFPNSCSAHLHTETKRNYPVICQCRQYANIFTNKHRDSFKKELSKVWKKEKVDDKIDSLLADKYVVDEVVDQAGFMVPIVEAIELAIQRVLNEKIVPLDKIHSLEVWIRIWTSNFAYRITPWIEVKLSHWGDNHNETYRIRWVDSWQETHYV